MNSLHINLLGIIAGMITASSFVPQVIKILTTKEVRDISLWMYIFLSTGISLWILYGVMVDSFPIIAANALGLIFSVTVIITKIIYNNN